MKRTGFTLVELLVVVAIIALLLGILIPGLSSAWEVSQRTACLGNHRALATAVVTYAMENNDYLPAAGWDGGRPEFDLPDKVTWLYDVTDGTHLVDLDAAELVDRVRTGAIWPMTGSHEVYRCPRDEPPYRTTEQRSSGHRYPAREMTSYTMNGSVAGFGRLANAEGEHFQEHPAVKMGQIPSRALIIWGTDEDGGPGYWNDGSNHPGETITRRHNDGATASKIDGSSAWVTFNEFERMADQRPGPLRFSTAHDDGG